ncbi:MAG: hypothetical protein DRP78_06085 [Candidatus Omnitrophota bacterium]|nr:MAG: hypothetical protein DRP78_06085 [Candidatus Omnitrophota bacterium]
MQNDLNKYLEEQNYPSASLLTESELAQAVAAKYYQGTQVWGKILAMIFILKKDFFTRVFAKSLENLTHYPEFKITKHNYFDWEQFTAIRDTDSIGKELSKYYSLSKETKQRIKDYSILLKDDSGVLVESSNLLFIPRLKAESEKKLDLIGNFINQLEQEEKLLEIIPELVKDDFKFLDTDKKIKFLQEHQPQIKLDEDSVFVKEFIESLEQEEKLLEIIPESVKDDFKSWGTDKKIEFLQEHLPQIKLDEDSVFVKEFIESLEQEEKLLEIIPEFVKKYFKSWGTDKKIEFLQEHLPQIRLEEDSAFVGKFINQLKQEEKFLEIIPVFVKKYFKSWGTDKKIEFLQEYQRWIESLLDPRFELEKQLEKIKEFIEHPKQRVKKEFLEIIPESVKDDFKSWDINEKIEFLQEHQSWIESLLDPRSELEKQLEKVKEFIEPLEQEEKFLEIIPKSVKDDFKSWDTDKKIEFLQKYQVQIYSVFYMLSSKVDDIGVEKFLFKIKRKIKPAGKDISEHIYKNLVESYELWRHELLLESSKNALSQLIFNQSKEKFQQQIEQMHLPDQVKKDVSNARSAQEIIKALNSAILDDTVKRELKILSKKILFDFEQDTVLSYLIRNHPVSWQAFTDDLVFAARIHRGRKGAKKVKEIFAKISRENLFANSKSANKITKKLAEHLETEGSVLGIGEPEKVRGQVIKDFIVQWANGLMYKTLITSQTKKNVVPSPADEKDSSQAQGSKDISADLQIRLDSEGNLSFSGVEQFNLNELEKNNLTSALEAALSDTLKPEQEITLPLLITYDLNQIIRYSPEKVTIHRNLLIVAENVEQGELQVLFLQGILYQQLYHFLHPQTKEPDLAQKTIEYYQQHPDVFTATLKILDQDCDVLKLINQDLKWLKKLKKAYEVMLINHNLSDKYDQILKETLGQGNLANPLGSHKKADTSVVAGMPLPEEVSVRLVEAQNQLKSAGIEEKLVLNKKQNLHLSIQAIKSFANKSEMNQSEIENQMRVFQKIAEETPEFEIEFKGINVGKDGGIFVQGYVSDTTLIDLRGRIREKFGIIYKYPVIVHISLGRVENGLTETEYQNLIKLIEQSKNMPFGKVKVKNLKFIKAFDSQGQEKEILLTVPLVSEAAEVTEITPEAIIGNDLPADTIIDNLVPPINKNHTIEDTRQLIEIAA